MNKKKKYKIKDLLPQEIDYSKFSLHANYNWLRAYEKINNLKVKYLVCFKNDKTMAFFPIFIRDILSFKEIVLPYLTIYNQIEYKIPNKKRQIDVLKEKRRINETYFDYISKNFSYVNINLFHDIYDIRGFSNEKNKLLPYYTYLINFKNFELDLFSKEIRSDIKKSDKLGLKIKKEVNIPIVLDLIKKTFARNNNKFCYTEVELKEVLKILNENNLFDQFSAYLGKEIVATHLVIPFHNKVFGFISATKTTFLRKGVNTWLTYNLLMKYTNSHDYFDYCGANIDSIAKYKEGFNPEIKLFFKLLYEKNNLINTIRKVKNR